MRAPAQASEIPRPTFFARADPHGDICGGEGGALPSAAVRMRTEGLRSLVLTETSAINIPPTVLSCFVLLLACRRV